MRSPEASVVELDKGKRYRVFVEAGRDPKTGKRVRHTKIVRGSRKDAERVKQELLIKVGSGSNVELTLAEFWHGFYLPHIKTKLRQRTVEGYESRYRIFFEGYLASFLLTRITPVVINTWLTSIEGDKRKLEAYKTLRQMLNKAVKWDLLDINPCSKVDVPRVRKYEPDVLTKEEAAEYLKTFLGKDVEAGVLIALGGGLRRSEIVALNWGDITQDGAITIDNAVTSVHGKAVDAETKTQFSNRVVHLPPSVAARLNELRCSDHEPLLMDTMGGRLHPDGFSKRYRETLKELPEGVKRLPLKNLRHTSLTLALESGTDILSVSRRAGHSDISVTAAFYLRPSKELDMKAASNLDRLFSE